MKITSEKRLENFEFWSGAKDLVAALTGEELSRIETILEEQYPEGMDETELNDIFSYDGDTLADWLGLKDEEYILKRTDPQYLLEEAKYLLEEAREDNFTPEFTFDDVTQFRDAHGKKINDKEFIGMSEEEFIESGWKQYVAEENGYTMEEVEDIADDYADTLDYLKLQLIEWEITFAIASFKKQEPCMPGGESFVHFRDRLTDKIENIKDILFSSDRDYADLLISDLNNCDAFLVDDREQEEQDNELSDR